MLIHGSHFLSDRTSLTTERRERILEERKKYVEHQIKDGTRRKKVEVMAERIDQRRWMMMMMRIRI